MSLVWVVIPLVLIVFTMGIVGVQESFATMKSSQNYAENWYLGEGLKKGDYFSYDLYYTLGDTCSLQLCKSNDPLEFQMDMWIKEDNKIGNETKWFAEIVVYDGNKIIKGEMELGKVVAEPTGGSEELKIYSNAFKSSIGWLSAFDFSYDISDEKKIEKSHLFPNANIGISYPPLEIETVTVPAGIWEAIVASWKYNGYASKIWVVDDFPFPIKAHVLTHVSEGIPPIEYKFELLDYRENVLEDPFVPVDIPEKSLVEESEFQNKVEESLVNNGFSCNEPSDSLSLFDITGNVISTYCWIDIMNSLSVNPFNANTINENSTIQPYDVTDLHPKISSELEQIIIGLPTLTTEQESLWIENDEAFIQIMIHVYEPNFVQSLPDYVQIRYELRTMVQALVPINKIYELESNPIVSNLKTIERAKTYDVLSEGASTAISVLSPKQQIKSGIARENVICNENLVLILRNNNSVACVKPLTAEKLIERGWTLGENGTENTINPILEQFIPKKFPERIQALYQESSVPIKQICKPEQLPETKKITGTDFRTLTVIPEKFKLNRVVDVSLDTGLVQLDYSFGKCGERHYMDPFDGGLQVKASRVDLSLPKDTVSLVKGLDAQTRINTLSDLRTEKFENRVITKWNENDKLITINGHLAVLDESSLNKIIFVDEDFEIYYSIQGYFSSNELIQMAESIK